MEVRPSRYVQQGRFKLTPSSARQMHVPRSTIYSAATILTFCTPSSRGCWFPLSRCLSCTCPWGLDSFLKAPLSLSSWFPPQIPTFFFSRSWFFSRESSWGHVSLLKVPVTPWDPDSLLEAPYLQGAGSILLGVHAFEVLFYPRGISDLFWGTLVLEVLTPSSRCTLRSWPPPQCHLFSWTWSLLGTLFILKDLIPSSRSLLRSWFLL